MSWPKEHRERICGNCLAKCAGYVAGEIEHGDDAAACPSGHWRPWVRPAPAPTPPQATVRVQGRKLTVRPIQAAGDRNVWGPAKWAELHGRPAVCDLQSEGDWLAGFAASIPCGECRRHWQAIVRTLPPRLDSRESYLTWTIAAHNRVNEQLGKALYEPLQTACRLSDSPAQG